MKKFALKSLLILFVVVFAALFFGKTLESLSTAKARFSRTGNGRLLKDEKLEATVFYQDEVEVTPPLAKKFPITINSVYFEKGNTVDKGDVIFAATIVDFDKKLKDINDNMVKKNAELLELDSKNAKFPQKTEKSERYFALKRASEALSRAKATKTAEAQKAGKEVVPALWQEEQTAYDRANLAFMQYARVATGADESFDYIVKRHTLLDELNELQKNEEELNEALATLTKIRASENGIITDISLKPGETYDGSKALYKFNSAENPPVLRAILPPTDDMPEVGDKGVVKVEYSKVNLKISDVGKTKDGQRYADFALTSKAIEDFGGIKKMLATEKIQITLQKRSATSSTLIPSSALREEGESKFVYVAEYQDNGLLGSYYKVKKLPVTVLGRNDNQVAIGEEFYDSLIDREDRPLKEGMRILEIKE